MWRFLKKLYWDFNNLSRADFAMFIMFPFLGISLIAISIYSIFDFNNPTRPVWIIVFLLGLAFIGLSRLYGKYKK
jgi:hypothetical protein